MTDNPNIAAMLAERARKDPGRLAIVEYRRGRARRITFGGLGEKVATVSAGLKADGVAVGDRVLLFVPMSIDLYALLLGCLHVGAIAVFVDAWADRRRLDAAVKAANPLVFVGTARAHLLRAVSGAVRRIPVHRTTALARSTIRQGQPHGHLPPEVVQPHDPALITFTTGSTGKPKAAARSHGFLRAQHEALAAHLQLSPEDVDMPTLPVFVLNNLALGVPSVIPDFDARRPAEIVPERIYRQMVAEGVTTSSGSPALYDRLAEWCQTQGLKLPLRALWTGGASVYPPLARRLADATDGIAHVVYGSTEAEPIAGIEAREMLTLMESQSQPPNSAGLCVGKPVREVAIRLIRPHDGPVSLTMAGWEDWVVGAGEVGEVVVSGSHVLGEYFNSPDETKLHKILEGGRIWHRTGDAALIDPEGRLWLMGRIAERVERQGKVWWSVPPELAALQTTGVTHASYLGIPDPSLGQRAVLCVEVASGLLSAHAVTALREAVKPSPIDDLVVVRRIPRDPRHASKTDLAALRRLLARRSWRSSRKAYFF